jgi:Protein of unknown function (DUF1592)/Protein of unknown function (DUF1588)/Protein of unknown function (DUF1587)/Protein of unknown function (DUF1585)/Protein of unknown function (DUF1595)/Planctomycete cytochrome C
MRSCNCSARHSIQCDQIGHPMRVTRLHVFFLIQPILAVWLVNVILSARVAATPDQSTRIASDEAFELSIAPLIENYCLDCHSGEDAEGDIALDNLETSQAILNQRKLWEKAYRQLGVDGMPPRDYDSRPTPEQRRMLHRWLDLKLHHVDCAVVNEAGRVTIRRLNRTEYDNTIRDLLGVDLRLSEDFPSDDVGYGFSNIGEVLSLSPLLFEKYCAASEKIAETAIKATPPIPLVEHHGTTVPEPSALRHPIIVARPSSTLSVAAASRTIFRRLMPRAYRRPIDDGEVERIVRLVEMATDGGESFERGIQIGLQAILVSPHFLFRVELGAIPNDSTATHEPTAQHPLNDFEVASRLSYFLWSSMPDDELFRVARSGKLHKLEVLDGQVARMLASSKADALVDNFTSQWLNLCNLVEVIPDPTLFPEFTPELRADMVRETKEFARTIFRQDLSLLRFIDADYTYLNQRLANHYGIEQVKGDAFRKVPVRSAMRTGVLTHASILTLTSNPNRTSLVRRGKWILDNVLGMDLPDPPAVIQSLEEGAKESGAKTMREQLKIHRENPTCASCHDTMDPLGFAFENFDAIGRWRNDAEGVPVDAHGTLPDGESFAGPLELAAILKQREREFGRLIATKMLTYALGRGLRHTDSCTIDNLTDDLMANDFRFTTLIRGIVRSKPFLWAADE